MNLIDVLFGKKLDKKQVKKNLLLDLSIKIREYIIEHKHITYAILIGIVILLIAIPIYINNYNKKVEESSKFFEYALSAYKNAFYNKDLTPEQRIQSLKDSINRFGGVAARFSGVPAYYDALFYQGHAFYELGDYNNAIKVYEKLADQNSSYYFIDFVLIDIGKCYEQLNNIQGALSSYQKVLDKYPKKAGAAYAMFNIAKIYELSNKIQESVKYYRQLTQKYPNSVWSQQARKRLLFFQTFMVRKPQPKQSPSNALPALPQPK